MKYQAMKKIGFILNIIALTILSSLFLSCEKEPDDGGVTQEKLELLISLPASIDGAAGDVISVKFYSGRGPENGDLVVLKQGSKEIVCQIVAIDSDSFSFKIAPEVASGKYTFCIKRGDLVKAVKDVQFNIEERVELAPKDGYNLYGIISCDGVGVPGVVVSDGIEVTVTDENGVYYLQSKEYNQLVFMSVPSGYEAVSNGVLPNFHKKVDGNPSTTERADWTLVKVDNHDHIMYIIGDMHLANRNNDLIQFAEFTDDLMKQVANNKTKRQYALTLGDMTWDLYWLDTNYDLYSYVETINTSLSGIQVFHTIGNHDHEMAMAGDFNTVSAYKNTVAPTYYSFNIGEIHYIVLDNILCTNDGLGSRTYESSLTTDLIAWLKNDISLVDKSKTIVITMHAQLYNEVGNNSMAMTSELENICKNYTTHVVTAHTHVVYNNDKTESTGIFHHNSGAVCGTWWWTGKYTPGLGLCKDGSPSGYYVYDMSGNDVRWRFKPTGKDFSYAFRTYDRNQICLTAKNFAPSANASHANAFEKSASDWTTVHRDNYVYFNVFDYDPSWSIEVTENGNILKHELAKVKDPLHLIAYEAQRHNDNQNPTSSFLASKVNSHIFRVKASSANSTLEFKVTDRFGNVYTESMNRPKQFSISAYRR